MTKKSPKTIRELHHSRKQITEKKKINSQGQKLWNEKRLHEKYISYLQNVSKHMPRKNIAFTWPWHIWRNVSEEGKEGVKEDVVKRTTVPATYRVLDKYCVFSLNVIFLNYRVFRKNWVFFTRIFNIFLLSLASTRLLLFLVQKWAKWALCWELWNLLQQYVGEGRVAVDNEKHNFSCICVFFLDNPVPRDIARALWRIVARKRGAPTNFLKSAFNIILNIFNKKKNWCPGRM